MSRTTTNVRECKTRISDLRDIVSYGEGSTIYISTLNHNLIRNRLLEIESSPDSRVAQIKEITFVARLSNPWTELIYTAV